MQNHLIKTFAQKVFSKEVKPGRRAHYYQAELWVTSAISVDEWRPLDDEDPLIFNIYIDVTGRLTFRPTERVSTLFHDEGAYQFRPVRKKWKLG